MNDHCAQHLSALVFSIENGEEIPPELRAHLATCAECARLLDAMNRMYNDLDAPPEIAQERLVAATVQKSAAAVFHSIRTRNVLRAIATAVAVVAGGWMLAYGVQSTGEGLRVVGVTLLIVAPLFIASALLWSVRERLQAPGQTVFRRLKPGRWLSGVCLGLSEQLKMPVALLRIGFIALFFANAFGFWLYVLLTFLLPVHPHDRQYLWRFRIAHAFRRA